MNHFKCVICGASLSSEHDIDGKDSEKLCQTCFFDQLCEESGDDDDYTILFEMEEQFQKTGWQKIDLPALLKDDM